MVDDLLLNVDNDKDELDEELDSTDTPEEESNQEAANTEAAAEAEPEEAEESADDSEKEPELDYNDPRAPKWYVLHTYSGYENKVKRTILQIVRNKNMEDQVLEVEVPEEEVLEVRDGKKKTVTKKVFPGYVLIKMHMNNDNWYVVRNVHGVTGFVGPNGKPVPLREDELAMMGVETDWVPDVDYKVGDVVKIINGPLESFTGEVEELDYDKKKVLITVTMFGRETPVELDFTQVMSI